MARPRFKLTPNYLTVAQAASRPQVRWEVVQPGCDVQREPPTSFGTPHPDLESLTTSRFPDLGVLTQDGGYLVGAHGWVATRDRRLVPELSWYGDNSDELRLPDIEFRERRVQGVCLSLTSDWSTDNYGHFLLDALGRWELFRRAGYEAHDVDHVYCGLPTRAALRLVERLGISQDQLIEPRRRVAVKADTLLTASFPGKRREYPPWLPPFLRSTFGPAALGAPGRRLYVPRTTARPLANEGALWPHLERNGFERYEPHEHPDPPADFAEAAIVVGPHGAGLADIAFCQSGAVVLELVPSDHVFPYWLSLATSAGLDYVYLIGPSVHERAPGSRGPSPYPFRVDEAEFVKALDFVVAAAEGRPYDDGAN